MGIEPLALASPLRWGTQAGVWSRLGGHGGITAAGDGVPCPETARPRGLGSGSCCTVNSRWSHLIPLWEQVPRTSRLWWIGCWL